MPLYKYAAVLCGVSFGVQYDGAMNDRRELRTELSAPSPAGCSWNQWTHQWTGFVIFRVLLWTKNRDESVPPEFALDCGDPLYETINKKVKVDFSLSSLTNLSHIKKHDVTWGLLARYKSDRWCEMAQYKNEDVKCVHCILKGWLKKGGPVRSKLKGLPEITIGDFAATTQSDTLKQHSRLASLLLPLAARALRKRLLDVLDVFGDKGYKPLGRGIEGDPFLLQVLEKPQYQFREYEKRGHTSRATSRTLYLKRDVRPDSWLGRESELDGDPQLIGEFDNDYPACYARDRELYTKFGGFHFLWGKRETRKFQEAFPDAAPSQPGPSAEEEAARREARERREREARERRKRMREEGWSGTYGVVMETEEQGARRSLGIDPSAKADRATIREAWRRKSLEFHPDRVKGTDEEKEAAAATFREIQEAYELLTEPSK